MTWQILDLCQALMAFDFLNLANLCCLESLMRHDMSHLVGLLYSAVISLYLFHYDKRMSSFSRHTAVSCGLVRTLRTSLLLPQGTGDAVRLEATLISKVHAGPHKVKLQFWTIHSEISCTKCSCTKSSPLLIFQLLIIVMLWVITHKWLILKIHIVLSN